MSLIDLVNSAVRRQKWQQLKEQPDSRAEIREAAQAVVEAATPEEEFTAIVRLSRTLP